MRSYAHLPTRLCWDGFSSLELFAQLDETARDAAGDRAGGQLERLADRAIGLVAREEAVEDLAAVLAQTGHRVVDVKSVIDPCDRIFVRIRRELALVGRVLARARPQAVDTDAARQLSDPGLDRLVAAERVEALVDLGEDLLEDVFGIVLAEAEPLRRDRVDIPREALDERCPGFLVAVAAAGDELRGRDRLAHCVVTLGRDLLLLQIAQPLGHHLEKLPGDLCIRL